VNIDTFLAKKAELEGLLKEHGKEMLRELFAELFAAAPAIKAVRWTQYTPYFNDGDACVFRIHDPEYSTVDPDGDGETGEDSDENDNDEDADEDGFFTSWDNAYEKHKEALEPFETKFGNAESILESLGDHSQITVTCRNGEIVIDVDDYEHD
jgi:hypothetical protein